MKKTVLAFLTGVLLLLPSTPFTTAASPHVVISEVQISGTTSTDEFVELYNAGSTPISLLNWRLTRHTASGTASNLLTNFPDVTLPAGGVFLITHPTGYTGSKTADATYSTQTSLAKDNSIVLYSDAGDTVVDILGLGAASTVETAAALNPDENLSLTRTATEAGITDTDNNAADFSVAPATPGVVTLAPIESPAAANPPPPATVGGGGGESNPTAQYTVGNIRINELVADPEMDDEWIELINTTASEISLIEWTLTDASGAITNLTSVIGTNDKRFLVVVNPKGQLNNTGDTITLRDPTGRIIDIVSYGNVNDDSDKAAPVAHNGQSIARKSDGVSTGNDAADFTVAITPTRGETNGLSTATNDGAAAPLSTAIIITEIFPNPIGDDDGEFIELFNDGETPVPLTGWVLSDTTTNFTLQPSQSIPTILPPRGYVTLYRSETNIALNNFLGDTITLTPPNRTKASQTIHYTVAAPVGKAYAKVTVKWQWDDPTPNRGPIIEPVAKSNIHIHLDAPTHVPIGTPVILSAEDTTDDLHEHLWFTWQLGDGATATGRTVVYTYASPGAYTVELTVSTARRETATMEHPLIIGNAGKVLGRSTEKIPVRFNELLPRPQTGEEWIELWNASDTPVNLLGWAMEDKSGHRYSFTDDDTLPARGFLVLKKTKTKISLNNAGDSLTLINNDENDVDEVTYDAAGSGVSYSRDEDDEWQWTTTATPNEANRNDAPPQVLLRGEVTVAGTVTAAPGTLSDTFFYLGRISATGIPENLRIDIGAIDATGISASDLVQINGNLKTVAGEARLTAATFSPLGHDDTPVIPIPLTALTPTDHLGRLVSVHGTVGKGTTGGFYLESDDSETIRVILPANVSDRQPFPAATTVTAVGILSQTAAGIRLLARGMEDLTVDAAPLHAENVPAIPASKRQWYLPITVVGLAGLLLIVFWRLRQRRTSELPFIIENGRE